jgi:Uma2 family endonuclease
MPSRTLVSVEEYLHTSYDPDCDYVDGEIVERNVGETDHSDCQGRIYAYFLNRSQQLRIYPLVEERVQVSRARFRIPDVCIVLGSRPAEQILTTPPLLCIEILSKDDRMSEMQERISDYLQFGVSYVWVVDPRTRRAWVYTKDGCHEAKDSILRTETPEIELPLPEIFQALE